MLATRSQAKKKSSGHKKPFDWAKLIFVCVLLFPALLHLALFWFGVEVNTIRMAFTDYNTNTFAGFANFQYIIEQFFGGQFTLFLRNTLLYGLAPISLRLYTLIPGLPTGGYAVIVAFYYFVSPLYFLSWHEFSLSRFDLYINRDNFPSLYRKGLSTGEK